LDERRRGTNKILPETITDESPLFRTYGREVKPLSYVQARKQLRKLFEKAGLDMPIVRGSGRKRNFHELRPHSFRKFFKTQLTALGVPPDYIEYMMGHKIDAYQDVGMKGIEFLRTVYASANLRIFPKPKASLADVLKEIIRARGEDPSKYLKEEFIAGRTVITEEEEVEIYAKAV